MASNIQHLLEQMTLEEKISLLAGASAWRTVPIERLGIPAIKVTDGPNGARGDSSFAGGLPSAAFPVGVALAATWNTDLIEKIGNALGEEVKSKAAHVLLAPTVNIHRSPLNGRNFECYSEDPFLAARIAVAYVKGVQSQGVGATIKHFIGNESEFERMTISSEIGERALREIYLPPFRAAVREAKVWAIMSSYNSLNGVHCSANAYTLQQILRDEWGFDGIVMSDWFGTRTTGQAVNAGLDLEMPGPTHWRGESLLRAVQAGEVTEEKINERALNILRLIERVGAFEETAPREEQANDRPEHRALIRRAGAESAVLLKNEAVLPIRPEKVKTIAIIGPNAKTAQIMGAGSAQFQPHYAVSPFEGIQARAGDTYSLEYALGCTNFRRLPVPKPEQAYTLAYFNNADLTGEPVVSESTRSLEQMWMFGNLPAEVNPNEFSARLSGEMIAGISGTHRFSVACGGKARLYVNSRLVADNWTDPNKEPFLFGSGSDEVFGTVTCQAGDKLAIRVEFSSPAGQFLSAVRVGYQEPIVGDPIAQAAAIAGAADIALVFVGLSSEWESEGYDRPDLELVKEQNALVSAVAAANPATVVVLQTGSPVTMPWFGEVAAVLQAWYPGQECGNAIADVLFGDVSPSGKLPQTYPVRLEDNPAYLNYPGDNDRVFYGEGIFVGYRYYDRKKIAPALPFGHGLSYGVFSYSDLRLSRAALTPDQSTTLSIAVTNSGDFRGQEVVQVYVRDVKSSVLRPEKELKGFAKVDLAPGETKTVEIVLDRESFAFYHDGQQRWMVEAGEFEVLVGSSSADIRLRASLTMLEAAAFEGRGHTHYHLDTPLVKLLQDDRVRKVFETHMPDLLTKGSGGAFGGDMSINGLKAMSGGFSDEQLAGIGRLLEHISD
ncbi:MAG: glycoside hydrolase family 3 C-terminal domain-containing protein [Chloroflexi bacterium]|nr:glycoside hydrolase family 3 C-terminal domain-containing protein [Chloroflexota bacterium]